MSATMVLAEQNRGGEQNRGRGERMRHGAGLIPDLTEEQQAKMQDLRLAMQKEALPLRAKIQTLQSELKLAMTAENYDEAMVKKLAGDIGAVKTDLHVKRLQHQRSVRNMLTPDQRKTFDLHLLSGRGHGGMGMMGDSPRHGNRKMGRRGTGGFRFGGPAFGAPTPAPDDDNEQE